MTENEIDKMCDYFTAIIAIAERCGDEYSSAVKTIALDASNYFFKVASKNKKEN